MGIFTKLFELFEDFCHSLDLELAFYHTEVDPSRYSLYSQELQRLHQYKVELQEAKQSESVLQQLATYMAVLIGESNPLTADLLHQSANTSKIVKQLETKIAASTAVVTREIPLNEGPFVKELDMALQSIGVHRQQYFGGNFVGNHVHKTLKLPNINTLCSAICKLAESSLPQKSEMVATRTMIFFNTFSKFAKCHSIYDQNFIDEALVHELEQSVQEFMELFRTNFPKGTIPIKMHMVEDHAVQIYLGDDDGVLNVGALVQVGVVPLHPLGPSVLDPYPLEVVLALVEYLTLVFALHAQPTHYWLGDRGHFSCLNPFSLTKVWNCALVNADPLSETNTSGSPWVEKTCRKTHIACSAEGELTIEASSHLSERQQLPSGSYLKMAPQNPHATVPKAKKLATPKDTTPLTNAFILEIPGCPSCSNLTTASLPAGGRAPKDTLVF
ncbi:hypothetical protein EMCRGX_G030813 [Ephydatia muelleri]